MAMLEPCWSLHLVTIWLYYNRRVYFHVSGSNRRSILSSQGYSPSKSLFGLITQRSLAGKETIAGTEQDFFFFFFFWGGGVNKTCTLRWTVGGGLSLHTRLFAVNWDLVPTNFSVPWRDRRIKSREKFIDETIRSVTDLEYHDKISMVRS